MRLGTQGITGWSYGRFFGGLAPIRIAVPAWRLPRQAAQAACAKAKVSREELMALFQTELHPAKVPVSQPDTEFTIDENQQRQLMKSLRSALYSR